MKIYNVTDPEFKEYGKVIEGYDMTELLKALDENTPCPEGTQYVAEEAAVQSLPYAAQLAPSLFGGLPVQYGWCNGHNTKLNCLEYHRSSEFNAGTTDFILLLAKQGEIDANFKLDTSKVKAFKVPAGVLVEVYATSLHYAPCQASKDEGFKVIVVLPQGTNVGTAKTLGQSFEDGLMRASNKWLLAHEDSSEAKNGAFVGLVGENIDIASDI